MDHVMTQSHSKTGVPPTPSIQTPSPYLESVSSTGLRKRGGLLFAEIPSLRTGRGKGEVVKVRVPSTVQRRRNQGVTTLGHSEGTRSEVRDSWYVPTTPQGTLLRKILVRAELYGRRE